MSHSSDTSLTVTLERKTNIERRLAKAVAISLDINSANRSSEVSLTGNRPSHALAIKRPLGLQYPTNLTAPLPLAISGERVRFSPKTELLS